jgi:hypothetical protein
MRSVALCRQSAAALVFVGALSCTEPVNPVPTITTLSPAEATAGTTDFTLTVDGSNFVRGSVVRWNGATRPTTIVSATRLTARLEAPDLSVAGTGQVAVFNPAPGGGLSNVVALAVRPRLNPTPTLTSISPAEITVAGSGEFIVTLQGADFLPDARVTFVTSIPNSNIYPTPTFVSPTQLDLTLNRQQFGKAATYEVTVTNPGPGGGTSAPRDFTARSPEPTVTTLSHNSVLAGKEADTLLVDGTGFYSESTVRINGAVRATTVVGPTRLEAILPASDLARPGSAEITVVNPAPGGGTSAAQPFRVTLGVPTIIDLPAQGGSAGGPGFSLAVDGANYVDGAIVQWNGQDRPTTYRTGTRLLAAISSADVATAGTIRITVRNPGVATTSNAVDFTLRTVQPARITSQLLVDLKANDVIWDATRGLLYASVPSSGGTHANSVAAIDPTTGAITKAVPVGSEPEYMAISDEGQYLYVSLRGSSTVRRVALASFAADIEFSIGSPISGSRVVVEEMLVVPGVPRTVVLSRMFTGGSRHAGIFVYDDGVRRGPAEQGHGGINSITFAGRSASLLYGYNNESSEAGFRRMVIGPSGVRVTHVTRDLMIAAYARIFGANGRVYGTESAIIDPEQRVRTGRFSNIAGNTPNAVFAEPRLGRVYFLCTGLITGHDMNTLGHLGSLSVPGAIPEHPYGARQRLVRWGTDGFAYRDGTRVYILRSTLAAP